MSNKVERMRKKIQNGQKRPSIFSMPLDRSFVHLLQQRGEPSSIGQPMPSLPAITPPSTASLSHSRTQRPLEEDYSVTGFHFSLVDRMHQSLLIQSQQSSRKCSEKRSKKFSLTCKPLNASLRTHGEALKINRTSPEKASQWRVKTSPKVIIMDSDEAVHPAMPRPSLKRSLKRPSFIEPIRVHTAPSESSPLRKFSISGWEAVDTFGPQ